MNKIYIPLIVVFILIGCGAKDTVVELSKKEHVIEKHKSKEKGNLNFEGITPDVFNPVASGNSSITIIIGKKAPTKISETKDTSTEDESESDFSLDYYIFESHPGYQVFWLLALSLLIYMIIKFIRNSAVAGALDKSLAMGIDLTSASIEKVHKKLHDADRGTDWHSDLLSQLTELEKERGIFQRDRQYKK